MRPGGHQMAHAWVLFFWRGSDGSRGHAVVRVGWAGGLTPLGRVVRDDVLLDHVAENYVPRDVAWWGRLWYDEPWRRP